MSTSEQISRNMFALRLAVLAKLGGKCIRCGFSDYRALQIDHKEGNTPENKLRKQTGKGLRGFYREILADCSQFQLLCANCNWIKRHERKEGMKYVPSDFLSNVFRDHT